MYDDATLEAMALDLESDLVERKESLSGKDRASKDRVQQTICAFANDLPGHRRAGVIFIGLRDDGRPSGLVVDDQLLLQLGGLRSDGLILPLPTMMVQRRRILGADVAIIEVEPSGEPPCAFEGRIWIRVGPRRAVASRDEERILFERRRAVDLPFDQRAVRCATLDDLDLNRVRLDYLPRVVAPEVLAANQRTITHQLASLHLATPDGDPTFCAILLFGREPRRWIPGAYVQFVRFDGPGRDANVLNEQELDGPLPQVLQRIDDLIVANIRVAVEVGTRSTELRRPDYAIAALQQVLRNAVMHRSYEATNAPVRWYWYSDRVEVESPGGLFGRVTPESLRDASATDYRNPSLAAAMKALGYVQRFGMGLVLARAASAEIGAPAPEARVTRHSVTLVLRRATAKVSIYLDPRGVLARPEGSDATLERWTPDDRSEGFDGRLRAIPPDEEAWRDALHDVDRAVRRAVQEGDGPIHVYPMAPYALALWLGRCLDRYARARSIVLHQNVPGTGQWLSLEAASSRSPQEERWFDITEEDLSEGTGVLLTVERAMVDAEHLQAIARAAGLRWIVRLRGSSQHPFDDAQAARLAVLELRAQCERLRVAHAGAVVHVVATAPVALLVEVGRLLSPTSVSSLIAYTYEPRTGTLTALLDVATGSIVYSGSPAP